MTVTNLTTTYTTLCLSLTRTEWGEVVVEQEALITLVEYIVNQLLVELGTQSNSSQ